jgi:hypothetical protein
VRIVIAACPKMGNMWLKCLLRSIYDLDTLGPGEMPERPDLDLFKKWLAKGDWPDETIFHQHYAFSPEFCDLVEAVPARLVTIIRDPYDAFVSLYFYTRRRAEQDRRKARRFSVLLGKTIHYPDVLERLVDRFRVTLDRAIDRPHGASAEAGDKQPAQKVGFDALISRPIDHPDVLHFLETAYVQYMTRAHDWSHSGRAVVVRYEKLLSDPLGELKRVTDQIQPVAPERIAQAIETCHVDRMRKIHTTNVRSGTVGDSRKYLNEAHLAVFRERYADHIRALGYEVR